MKHTFFAFLLSIAMFLSATAFAQDPAAAPIAAENEVAKSEAPVNIIAPVSWIPSQLPANAMRIAAFVDPKTESSIEILSKQLIRAEHVGVLTQAFDKKILASGFEKVATGSSDRSFTLLNNSSITGAWNEYIYITNDIHISVSSFIFTHENYAIIVVGYFSAADRENGIDAMQTLIKNMTPKVSDPAEP